MVNGFRLKGGKLVEINGANNLYSVYVVSMSFLCLRTVLC